MIPQGWRQVIRHPQRQAIPHLGSFRFARIWCSPSAWRMEGARMARRMFAVVDVVKLLRHWQAGDNVSQMARALGLDRKTVRKYVGRAAAAGLVPGGAAFSQAEWASRVRAWFPELK